MGGKEIANGKRGHNGGGSPQLGQQIDATDWKTCNGHEAECLKVGISFCIVRGIDNLFLEIIQQVILLHKRLPFF